MKLKLAGTILTFLFTINMFSQTVEKAKVKVIKSPELEKHELHLIPITKEDSKKPNINKTTTSKVNTAIYLITYKKNDCHIKIPKKVYRQQGESLEQLKNRVANEEKGEKYKISTYNYINKSRPFGVLYSMKCKNGGIKYSLGLYTTIGAAQKRCDELNRSTSSSNYKCEEIISLN